GGQRRQRLLVLDLAKRLDRVLAHLRVRILRRGRQRIERIRTLKLPERFRSVPPRFDVRILQCRDQYWNGGTRLELPQRLHPLASHFGFWTAARCSERFDCTRVTDLAKRPCDLRAHRRDLLRAESGRESRDRARVIDLTECFGRRFPNASV